MRVSKKSIKLSLPPNFGKNGLFDQLPYLAHLRNPVIVDVIKIGIMDNLSLQKYLLVTGLLKDSIQGSLDINMIRTLLPTLVGGMIITYSLDMIVSSDRKLIYAVVRTQLDTKFASAMRKPNPIDAVFKGKVKFDTEKPIIGTLLTQMEAGKLDQEKQIKKYLQTAPFVNQNCRAIKRIEKF